MRDLKSYTIENIKLFLYSFVFTRKISAIHIHHTGSPTKADYAGVKTIQGMWKYHTDPEPNGRGWSDIGYHIIVVPDGNIYTGRDLNRDPASIYNYNSGAIAVAILGNFQAEILKGPQKKATIELIRILLKVCDLGKESIIFHREKASTVCPGKNIDKDEFLSWIDEEQPQEYVHIRPVEVISKGNVYKGYILPDGKSYVEVRQLLQDLGLKIEWKNEKVIVRMPEKDKEKLDMIKIIVGE